MLLGRRIGQQRRHGFGQAEADDPPRDARAAERSSPCCSKAVASARVDGRAAVDERAVAVEDRQPVHFRGRSAHAIASTMSSRPACSLTLRCVASRSAPTGLCWLNLRRASRLRWKRPRSRRSPWSSPRISRRPSWRASTAASGRICASILSLRRSSSSDQPVRWQGSAHRPFDLDGFIMPGRHLVRRARTNWRCDRPSRPMTLNSTFVPSSMAGDAVVAAKRGTGRCRPLDDQRRAHGRRTVRRRRPRRYARTAFGDELQHLVPRSSRRSGSDASAPLARRAAARSPFAAPLAPRAFAAAATLRCFASGAELTSAPAAEHRPPAHRSPASQGSPRNAAASSAVTSIVPPSGASILIRRAWRWSLRLIPPVRNASGPPYLASPTIGWPIAAMCARSWCVRPVSGCSSTQAARLPARSISRQRVLAGSPCSGSTCIFSPPVPGCLASGASMTPSSASGTPTTSAQ